MVIYSVCWGQPELTSRQGRPALGQDEAVGTGGPGPGGPGLEHGPGLFNHALIYPLLRSLLHSHSLSVF